MCVRQLRIPPYLSYREWTKGWKIMPPFRVSSCENTLSGTNLKVPFHSDFNIDYPYHNPEGEDTQTFWHQFKCTLSLRFPVPPPLARPPPVIHILTADTTGITCSLLPRTAFHLIARHFECNSLSFLVGASLRPNKHKKCNIDSSKSLEPSQTEQFGLGLIS